MKYSFKRKMLMLWTLTKNMTANRNNDQALKSMPVDAIKQEAVIASRINESHPLGIVKNEHRNSKSFRAYSMAKARHTT